MYPVSQGTTQARKICRMGVSSTSLPGVKARRRSSSYNGRPDHWRLSMEYNQIVDMNTVDFNNGFNQYEDDDNDDDDCTSIHSHALRNSRSTSSVVRNSLLTTDDNIHIERNSRHRRSARSLSHTRHLTNGSLHRAARSSYYANVVSNGEDSAESGYDLSSCHQNSAAVSKYSRSYKSSGLSSASFSGSENSERFSAESSRWRSQDNSIKGMPKRSKNQFKQGQNSPLMDRFLNDVKSSFTDQAQCILQDSEYHEFKARNSVCYGNEFSRKVNRYRSHRVVTQQNRLSQIEPTSTYGQKMHMSKDLIQIVDTALVSGPVPRKERKKNLVQKLKSYFSKIGKKNNGNKKFQTLTVL